MSKFEFHNDSKPIVIIDELRIPLSLFQEIEPEFKPTVNVIRYIPGELHIHESGSGVFHYEKNWEDGDRYIQRKEEFQTLVKHEEIRNKKLSMVNHIQRSKLMSRNGQRELVYPPIDKLIVALWEHIVEKKDFEDSGINSIQKQRLLVKREIP